MMHGMGFSELYSLFKSLDADGNGSITESDFVSVVHRLGLGGIGEQAVHHMFLQVDKNKNGKIDINEAVGLINQLKSLVSHAQASGFGGFGGFGNQ